MGIISNFTANNEAKRGLVWSDEREMFLLRPCLTMNSHSSSVFAGNPQIIPNEVLSFTLRGNIAKIIFEPRLTVTDPSRYPVDPEDPSTDPVEHYINMALGRDNDKEVTRILVEGKSVTYRLKDEEDNLLLEKVQSSEEALMCKFNFPGSYLYDYLPRMLKAKKLEVVISGINDSAANEYLSQFGNGDIIFKDAWLFVYDMDPGFGKLGFPPVNYLQNENPETHSRFTDARIIKDANAVLRYDRDSNTYTLSGNGHSIDENYPNRFVISPHKKFERPFLGCTKEEADARLRPMTKNWVDSQDFNVDPYDTLMLNNEDVRESTIHDFEMNLGASTGWHVYAYHDGSDVVPAYLTFGCLFASDHDLGEGHSQQNPGWNNVFITIPAGTVTSEVSTYGTIYRYVANQLSNVYSSYYMPVKKIFTHTHGGKTWHYYYWEGSTEHQCVVWGCFGAPKLQVNYEESDLEIRYLSAFVTIH